MKKAKKLLAVLLMLVLLLSLVPAAGASSGGGKETAMTNTGSVTITNAVAGNTYYLYRVFDLSATNGLTSTEENPNTGLNVYITNQKWDAAVRSTTDLKIDETTSISFDDYVTIETKDGTHDYGYAVTPKTGFAFTDKAAAQLFATLVVDVGKQAAGTGTIDAEASITATSSRALTFNNLQYGYYVMYSTRGDQYTTFTLNTSKFNITGKNVSYPQISKMVAVTGTLKNGTLSAVTSPTYFDGISADIGDELTYQITIIAAAGTDVYMITDLVSGGTTTYTSLEVNQEITSGSTTTLSPLTQDADDGYTLTSGSSGEVIITLKQAFRTTLKDGDKIIITYKCSLNSSVSSDVAVINTASLAYGESAITDSARVYTGELKFDKKKSDGGGYLEGAEFMVTKTVGSTKYYAKLTGSDPTYTIAGWYDEAEKGNATTITTNNSTITVKGLAAGTYTLEETKAPTGYIKDENIEPRTIATTDAVGATGISGITSPTALEIVNIKGTELPATGGMGTTVFYAAGALLILGALALLAARRRPAAR